MRDSTDFDWDTQTPDWRPAFELVFDVREAKRLLSARPHPVRFISTHNFRHHVVLDTEGRERADPSLPLIFIQYPDGRSGPLIDGEYRLTVAARRGLAQVPLIFLTPSESAAISKARSNPEVWRRVFGVVKSTPSSPLRPMMEVA
jgi:hypothetical protein